MCDTTVFQNDWMEVEIKEALNWGTANSPSAISNSDLNAENGVPHFLRDEISPYLQNDECNKSLFYHCRLTFRTCSFR